jgi:hypothetical protein
MGKETDKEVQDGFLKGIGTLVLAGSIIVYFIFVNGFLGLQYYKWFIQPYLNTPNFTLIQFIGFVVFIRSIVPVHNSWIKDEYKEENRAWKIVLFPWIGYFIAMLFHSIAQ